VGNTVFGWVVASVLLMPLIALLPVTLPLAILATKRWRYQVDEGRVIAWWGVLFRKRSSVLLDRVDSLQQNQGPLGKMFQNGRVSIMTAGSSKPDLVMSAAKDFRKLYQAIRERSQGG
jgi:membrane protein YdbS with pleckstrin-like domain